MAAAAFSDENGTDKLMASDSFTFFSFVDEVESRVEDLRRQATALMGEQASLLAIADQLKNDCMKCNLSSEDSQELLINMERLKARCEAVQIQVHTVRDDGQLQSLDKVNNVLQELQTRLASNDNVPRMAVKQARSYLNACLPEAVGSIDTRFQSLVLGCAVDDQKDVRRRLQSLVRESNVDLESGSSKSRNTNENYTATTERSDNLTENSVYTGTATVNRKPPSSGEQTGDVVRETSGPSENHHTAQWYTATSTKPGSFDDSDLSVSQQEGESIQQVHLKEGNASPRSHSRQPHFDGPIKQLI